MQYLVSILRNGWTGNAEVDSKNYSVVYWLIHASNVENAALGAGALRSKLWNSCMKFLLASNEFQAWKTAFPRWEWGHRRYCMYTGTKLITPLHIASSYGLTRLTELLLDRVEHTDISAAQGAWETPLHLTARAGHETVARLRIEKGAEVLAATENGETVDCSTLMGGNFCSFLR